MKVTNREERRQRIRFRIRKRVRGTAERPRLSVFRSVTHIYVQVVDDLAGQTLAAASSVEPAVKAKMADGARAGNNKGAGVVGEAIAERLKAQGISRVVFDRNGFLYHGRVKRGRRGRPQGRARVLANRKAHMRTRERIDAGQLEIKDTVVAINRVTKVVKGGKNLSFSALVVVGDGQGVVGFGIGKAKEVPSAIKKGIEAAKKNLIRVPLKGTSIPHPALGRYGAGRVLLKPAPEGTGHHRRRRRPRRGRVVRHPQRADQVARAPRIRTTSSAPRSRRCRC